MLTGLHFSVADYPVWKDVSLSSSTGRGERQELLQSDSRLGSLELSDGINGG